MFVSSSAARRKKTQPEGLTVDVPSTFFFFFLTTRTTSTPSASAAIGAEGTGVDTRETPAEEASSRSPSSYSANRLGPRPLGAGEDDPREVDGRSPRWSLMSARRDRSFDGTGLSLDACWSSTAPSGISPSRSMIGGGSTARGFFFFLGFESDGAAGDEGPRSSLTTGMEERSSDSCSF